jgi:uncharacterized protein YwqG
LSPHALAPQAALLESLIAPYARVAPDRQIRASRRASSFFGAGYWCARKPYPCDAKGKPLALLAQFDLSEPGYLGDGILQVYFDPVHPYFGVNLADPEDASSMKVVYWSPAEIASIRPHELDAAGSRPSYAPAVPVRLERNWMLPTPADVAFKGLKDRLEAEQGEVDDDILAGLSMGGSRIGGYADFLHDDPRLDSQWNDWRLLAQIDTAMDGWPEDAAGLIHLFVPPGAIERSDFSRVKRYYDDEQ